MQFILIGILAGISASAQTGGTVALQNDSTSLASNAFTGTLVKSNGYIAVLL